MTDSQTLREWLRGEIAALLARDVSPPPLVLWCDPEQAWRGLLMAAAGGQPFELWCEDEHELVLRERLLAAPPAARVVWLPVGREGITYLKVFELQADHVWTEPLKVALARFGVEIPREYDPGFRDALRSYAREWIDRPRSDWRDLTPSGARSALVDEDQILLALARVGCPVGEVIGEDRAIALPWGLGRYSNGRLGHQEPGGRRLAPLVVSAGRRAGKAEILCQAPAEDVKRRTGPGRLAASPSTVAAQDLGDGRRSP